MKPPSTLRPRKRAPFDRFLDHILVPREGSCWIWGGALGSHGYGVFGDRARHVRAHRYAYEHFVGPIPDGLQIDHLCRTPACVNPEHLEPVTNRENTLRGRTPKWLCPKGHTKDGLRMSRGHLHRYCLICTRESNRRSKRKARAIADRSS